MCWVDEKFRWIDLGDKRRDSHAALLAEHFAQRPTASVTGTCDGWAETQAAYQAMTGARLELIIELILAQLPLVSVTGRHPPVWR